MATSTELIKSYLMVANGNSFEFFLKAITRIYTNSKSRMIYMEEKKLPCSSSNLKANCFSGFISIKTVLIVLVLLTIISLTAGLISLLIERNEQNRVISDLQHNMQILVNENKQLSAEIEALQEQLALNAIHDDAYIYELEGLVEVRAIDNTIEVELIYATGTNFTGQVLYPFELCLLQRNTAEKLAAANAEFALNGYRIKVWDAFRPRNVQKIMWEHAPSGVYVADPAIGSNHNRGAAVDVTLVDEDGRELEMPTGFDEFTEKASRSYTGMSAEARSNMEYLTEVMIKHGFTPIQSEWWHFNDSDIKNYPLLDITFEDYVNAYFSSF